MHVAGSLASENMFGIRLTTICRCDGIGRRSGLKIHRQRWRAGSSPATGTTLEQALCRLLRLFSKVRARSCRCSSFPTATRCAGLAVGGPPCGRHFSFLTEISVLTALHKKKDICLCRCLSSFASAPFCSPPFSGSRSRDGLLPGTAGRSQPCPCALCFL